MMDSNTPPPLPSSLPETVPPVAGPPPLPRVRGPLYRSLIAWVVILASVTVAALNQNKPEQKQPNHEAAAALHEDMMGRYAVGAKAMFGTKTGEAIVKQMNAGSADKQKPAVRFRVELLRAYLAGEAPSQERMLELAETEKSLLTDLETVHALREGGASDEAWNAFQKRHGWIAKLPKAQGMAADSAFTKEMLGEAKRTATVMVGGVGLALLAGLCGTGLLVLWFIGKRQGKYPPAFTGVTPGLGAPLLEGTAIFFAGFVLLPLLCAALLGDAWPWWAKVFPALLGIVVGFLWPRWRGLPREIWKWATGWHLGRGFWREAGCGVLGWIASLPLLAVWMLLLSWLMQETGQEVSHPITEAFQGPLILQLLALLMAAVWAPITEEIIFRGIFFSGMTARCRWWVAALVTSVIFAAIHPQGWLAIPALATIAMVMATLRRWRGSLVAPMTAHACNNGVLMLFLIFAL